MRGYAPTAVPGDGRYQTGVLGLDACALHEALDGGDDAVIIGHDWGAMATYTAANHEPDRWRRVVTMAVPPSGAVGAGFMQYRQLKKSWYMFFFQHGLADVVVGMNDLEFIDGLWADWSPGYDASEDLPHVKDALRDPANLAAAIGYYRATLGGVGVDPSLDAVQAAGAAPTSQPTLYLHGRTDGCMGVEIAEGATPVPHLRGLAARAGRGRGALPPRREARRGEPADRRLRHRVAVVRTTARAGAAGARAPGRARRGARADRRGRR